MQSQILVGRPSERGLPESVVDGIYRFRHRVFRERLGWSVPSMGGRERDDFDDLDPVFIAARAQDSRVTGTFRLLPTTGPYMLREVFPELLRGESVPCASDVWELSRFAVEPTNAGSRIQANASGATIELMRACYRYAADHGIREYVMATSVSVERMLRGMGIGLERFGDGRAQRFGRVLSVGCRLQVDEALARALGVTAAPVAAPTVEREVA